MKEVHAVAVVDKDGRLALEVATDLAPGMHRLTLLVEELLVEGSEDPANVRRELGTLVEDWDKDEMSVYDAL